MQRSLTFDLCLSLMTTTVENKNCFFLSFFYELFSRRSSCNCHYRERGEKVQSSVVWKFNYFFFFLKTRRGRKKKKKKSWWQLSEFFFFYMAWQVAVNKECGAIFFFPDHLVTRLGWFKKKRKEETLFFCVCFPRGIFGRNDLSPPGPRKKKGSFFNPAKPPWTSIHNLGARSVNFSRFFCSPNPQQEVQLEDVPPPIKKKILRYKKKSFVKEKKNTGRGVGN